MNKEKLLKIIREDEIKKENFYRGDFYYNYSPTFLEEEQRFIKNGIPYKIQSSKTEIYVNYFKMLVTQKIDFILAKKPTIDKAIKETLKLNVWTMLDKMLKQSSLDSKTWLHPYMHNNKLKYKVIKDEEIITKYDGDELIQLIRYYRKHEDLYIEIWTDKGKQLYIFDKENNLKKDTFQSHYLTELKLNDEVIETINSNFYKIPFIKLENNKDVTSDYFDIECLLSAYNSISNGFIDNVFLFQEALLILKGFVGDNEELKRVIQELKKTKGLSVPADGNIDYLKVDIPVEARQALLEMLKDAIFLIGRGADPNKLGDGNITNIVIKSRYVFLELKASDCIKRLTEFYEEFIEFLNIQFNYNFSDEIEFNTSMLVNESELIGDCVKSMNLLPIEIILKYHPWVEDVKEAMKLKEAEEEANLKKMEKEAKILNNNTSNTF